MEGKNILTYMLELNKGQSSEKIVVTLNELKTIDTPYYLFVFTNVTSKQVVSFIAGADESGYPERYNQFDVNTDLIFGDYPSGEWHYKVYEQVSSVNTNPSLSTGVVEYGKMYLYSTDDFEYTKYNEPVTYKSYGG